MADEREATPVASVEAVDKEGLTYELWNRLVGVHGIIRTLALEEDSLTGVDHLTEKGWYCTRLSAAEHQLHECIVELSTVLNSGPVR